jgi:3',5'-nucleoside bisphosphate phosphatase
MNQADLHVHSGYSDDGELEIKDIIEKCILNKVEILSVTDHNSVKGIQEAASICSHSGIKFISGIEIDCAYNNIDLHLLGYNIDWNRKDFDDLEKNIKKKILDSFPQMIENLDKSGIKVDPDEVLEKSNGKMPCGELIAEVLLSNRKYHSNKMLAPYMIGGERSDMPYINFYHDFFAQGKPAYVKIDYMSFSDAINLVRRCGGTPVIAHPGMNLRGKEELIPALLDCGVDGVEVFNNYHGSEQIEYIANLACQKNLLMTCGSDFHGKNKPLIEIGKYRINEKYQEYLSDSITSLCNL